ncbi:hypothetical protein BZK21_04945 [Helicobacter pylori]|uniref:hypothetical protein n=1 Tax=Helicobacter pylori TaxID=210 RepID=UPI0009843267|nr:hypothetical protein [Helicobacter pylori]OOC25421.1 hypothetical protein BZK21_04945 [Helicobacter pylori]
MKQLSPLKDPTNPQKPLFLEITACFLQAFYIYFNNIYFNKRFLNAVINTQLKTNSKRTK